ncbi:RAB6A [Symbiodinium natans]|uniref:RAB6A protein n=1 Tax=Symbiodinium natans TaxID=878477 RepID=A0A812LXP8_9DINO|nr:RAB6A [Symbiodinium natans]
MLSYPKISEVWRSSESWKVIAFALHVQSGNFAQALRSISKTRWTTITGDSLVINMVSETLHDWTITNLEVVNVDIDPVASFMYGGLLDVVTLLVEVNSQGQQRARRRRFRIPSASTGSPEKPFRRPSWKLISEGEGL